MVNSFHRWRREHLPLTLNRLMGLERSWRVDFNASKDEVTVLLVAQNRTPTTSELVDISVRSDPPANVLPTQRLANILFDEAKIVVDEDTRDHEL